MDILNGFISGTDNNSSDIILVLLILVIVLGFGENTGFNKVDGKSSGPHHKHRRISFNSSGG